jgi:hypothetical protein
LVVGWTQLAVAGSCDLHPRRTWYDRAALGGRPAAGRRLDAALTPGPVLHGAAERFDKGVSIEPVGTTP